MCCRLKNLSWGKSINEVDYYDEINPRVLQSRGSVNVINHMFTHNDVHPFLISSPDMLLI